MKWLSLLYPLLAFAADPTQLPPQTKPPQTKPLDVLPSRLHIVQRATLVDTNKVRCTTNCPVALTRMIRTADLSGPAQFQWFRLWASTNADMHNQFVWGTNRVGWFEVPYKTNGAHLFTVLAIVDEALPFDSAGRKR